MSPVSGPRLPSQSSLAAAATAAELVAATAETALDCDRAFGRERVLPVVLACLQ